MPTNKLNYIAKYNKEKYKMYQFRIKKSETKIIEKLDKISNRNGYIANLIMEDVTPSVLTIRQIKERILPITSKYKIEDVYLFGSYARGEANRNSDVDIYCSAGDVKNLYDVVDFKEELENSLGKKVDVVFIGSTMHEYFRAQLEKDKIKIK